MVTGCLVTMSAFHLWSQEVKLADFLFFFIHLFLFFTFFFLGGGGLFFECFFFCFFRLFLPLRQHIDKKNFDKIWWDSNP